MARPRCSRNEPKRLRSSGAITRRESTYTRTTSPVLGGVWADNREPLDPDSPNTEALKRELELKAIPALAACCRKRRRSDEGMESPRSGMLSRRTKLSGTNFRGKRLPQACHAPQALVPLAREDWAEEGILAKAGELLRVWSRRLCGFVLVSSKN